MARGSLQFARMDSITRVEQPQYTIYGDSINTEHPVMIDKPCSSTELTAPAGLFPVTRRKRGRNVVLGFGLHKLYMPLYVFNGSPICNGEAISRCELNGWEWIMYIRKFASIMRDFRW